MRVKTEVLVEKGRVVLPNWIRWLNNRKVLGSTLFIGVCLVLAFVCFIIVHEGAHYAIGINYDCKPYFGFMGWSPATFYDPAECTDLGAAQSYHAINEIVGYNLWLIFILMVFGMVIRSELRRWD